MPKTVKLSNDFKELYSDLNVLKNQTDNVELQRFIDTVKANLSMWQNKLDIILKSCGVEIAIVEKPKRKKNDKIQK